ncbi:MAG: hypothetical protein LQ352_000881 [Teloschistes flavicans]|nr:MAG: hypothetical protein LQ352_000881 [Teloschistes flavicans]
MDQWLDSLSEDWVSQPVSPRSDHLRRSSSALSAASSTSNVSQSRIPRYKPRAGSSLSPNGATLAKRHASVSVASDGKSVLKERSSSNLNASRNRVATSIVDSRGPIAEKKIQNKQRTPSSAAASTAQDTIQHKTSKISPAKENDPGSTPEWRRRVLQGKTGAAGPDLFGPIGLESIFKPPTVGRASKTGGKQRGAKKFQPTTVDDFPSSPPPFPSDLGSIERSGGTEKRRSSLLKQMEILEEVSEGDSRVSLPRKDRYEIQEAFLSPVEGSMKAMPSAVAEEDHNEVLSQVILPTNQSNDQVPPIGAVGQRADRSEVPGESPEPGLEERRSFRIQENNLLSSASASPSTSVHGATPASDWTSHSLPDDLSTGTDLYVANGGFVNMRRGGYSNEGSFQRRPLSPSSLPDFDAPELRSPSPGGRRLSIRSRRSNVQDGSAHQPLSAPVTPRRKQHQKSSSAEELQSSGSPLKLFDKYDTFTNERLIRRISRFEQSTHESETDLQEENPELITSVSVEEGKAVPQETRHGVDKTASRLHRRISSFGAGQLDSYPFQTSHPLGPRSERASREILANAASNHQEAISRTHTITMESRHVDDVVQIDVVQIVNGKRLPHSPAKEAKAKRRRTLQGSEEPDLEIYQRIPPRDASSADRNGGARVQAADVQPSASRSIAGKKRKDARYDTDSQVADPKVLASRQILLPRSATPGQRHTQKVIPFKADVSKLKLNMDGANDETESLGIDLDHQTQALAGELATFTLNMAQDMTQGQRKASVTTADFFNEAKEIMKLIRNQGRPQSSHDIAEEPEEDDGESRPNNFEESTVEEFSRPPSREGGSLRRLREPAVMDARVASHLRKFEDTDDLGLALPSSAESIHINQSHEPSMLPSKGTDEELGSQGSEIMSDPPNIRIRAAVQGTEIEPRRIAQEMTGSHIPSSGSQKSSDPSTGRSVPTGSSRGSQGSGTRAVIAPQVVSHLLSDNMGTMTFDHSKKVWVKRRSSRNSQSADAHSRSGSDVTENLFQDIPDLSVDEFEELQRTEKRVICSEVLGSASDRISNHDHLAEHPLGVQSSRPPTEDNEETEAVDQSSAPSKFSQFASSEPIPETRATSWGDQVIGKEAINAKVHVSSKTLGVEGEEHNEEVEHEISILEGRISSTPRHVRHVQRQPRVVTVAFSSPLVDRVETLKEDSETTQSDDDDGSDLDLSDSPVQDGARSSSASQKRSSAALGKRSTYRGASRRTSIGFARPMSRVDENEELTFLQSSHRPANASMDLVVTTPLATSRSVLLQSTFSSAQASSIGFQLSPLSEFTVHKDDRLAHRDVSRAVRHRGLLAMHEVEGHFSLAVQDLVKKLTDLEPYEPYWNYIRHVDLRNRHLHSLHMLDEFCGHIEDLDVSDNDLRQLEGAPQSIRHLKARNNCLSNLMSWGHLHNLQYLDVSGNQIQNLVGFQSLIHLRELRADDNQIESLEGILGLDGLIKVTLRNNHVMAADFEGCNLARLTHLDLRHNKLNEVVNLDQLPLLRHLDLSQNYLQQISFPPISGSLEHLQLADNQLCTLDIGPIHRLKYLDIDRNTIQKIANVASHTCLEVLSWREQGLSMDQSEARIHYQQCHNVRELYLSGNILRVFAPNKHLLSLQHLELASTGLQSLSEDFGVKCPNVRVLNLNFNAVTELRPLLGIVNLQKLYLAENRVSRLRRTASVFDRIGLELAVIDLRQNPLTLGYYTSQQKSGTVTEQRLTIAGKTSTAPGVDDDAFEGMEKCASYLLLPIDQGVDDAAQNRLDEDTSTRRRVYEMLISLRCRNLQILDGVTLDRRKIASRDGVWERLRQLGVITNKIKDGALELEG